MWDPLGPTGTFSPVRGPGSIASCCEMGPKMSLFAQRDSSPLGHQRISEIVGHKLLSGGSDAYVNLGVAESSV